MSSLIDPIFSLFVQYSLPTLFTVLFITAMGVPLPATFVLILAGSLVEQGELSMIAAFAVAFSATVMGDNIGYFIGRWGGVRLQRRLTRWMGASRRAAA